MAQHNRLKIDAGVRSTSVTRKAHGSAAPTRIRSFLEQCQAVLSGEASSEQIWQFLKNANTLSFGPFSDQPGWLIESS
ncbi:hypothetical protein X744_32355 [Mesorhizobium sp. LNJC372A00]|nr:hypothetical protein X745_30745 [Mesorhizobium sp. LNJC374B00]ESY48207.1 hypothetical protein X744_32355 [Mesorhizobium sp. LNJC372A00]